MKDIIINGTAKLPTVNLDSVNGLVEISGRSIPEDGKEFYDEIIKWLKEYRQNARPVTTLIFRLEYLNSSSHISVKNILLEVTEMMKEKKNIKIEWYYERDDSSMLDIANDYKEITDLPFDIIDIDKF